MQRGYIRSSASQEAMPTFFSTKERSSRSVFDNEGDCEASDFSKLRMSERI